MDQCTEGHLPEDQLSTFLILMNLMECDSSRPIAVQFLLLCSQCSGNHFGGSFCGGFLLLPWELPWLLQESLLWEGALWLVLTSFLQPSFPVGVPAVWIPKISVWRSSSSLVSIVNCFFTSLSAEWFDCIWARFYTLHWPLCIVPQDCNSLQFSLGTL